MTSPLERLAGPGKPLVAEPPDGKEFAGLKRSGLARLKDAENAALSLEGRFDLAYNAAHALSLAALRYHGFRARNRCVDDRIVADLIAAGRTIAGKLNGLPAINDS